MIELSIHGQTIALLPERAAWWKEQNTLIVCDIHLGKATGMRKKGIPVPEGAMEADLMSLGYLIRHMAAKRCVIVGDLIHAKLGLSEQVATLFANWIKKLNCEIDLVFGNHDRALIKHLPHDWSLHCYHDHLIREPFCFSHVPKTVDGSFVWSGHIHPQITLKSGKERLTLRCFQIFTHLGILPAFSSFVGGAPIKREKESRIFVTTGQEVIEV